MNNHNMYYDYKQQCKRNGNVFIAIRDKGENTLLEVEKKGEQVDIITNWHNEKITMFSLPIELFEKLHNDIIQSK